MGRPSKYKPEYAEQCYKLCLLGHTDRDLGEFFGVSHTCIQKWAEKYEEFGEALRNGKELADAEVANSLYNRAKGGLTVTKQKLDKEGVVVDLEEELPPDVRAMETWLASRRKKKEQDWNPNHKVEHSGEISNPLAFVLDEIDEEAEHESITGS